MNCKRAQADISLFLDERLDPSRQAKLNKHLEACEDCSEYLEQLRVGLAMLREMPLDTPSPQFEWNLKRKLQKAQLEAQILREREGGKSRHWAWFAASAAAALVISLGGAGLWYASLDSGSPLLSSTPGLLSEPAVAQRHETAAHPVPLPVQTNPSDMMSVGDAVYGPLRPVPANPPSGSGEAAPAAEADSLPGEAAE